jgi:hypothetical protein
MIVDLSIVQREVCQRFSLGFYGCNLALKLGVAKNVKSGLLPINGMRIEPTSETSGWYIWAGTIQSQEADFFQPLHGYHVSLWSPLVAPYLGLPPGSRFLVTDVYEDVWIDSLLLKKD